jgi:hypothetical protein
MRTCSNRLPLWIVLSMGLVIPAHAGSFLFVSDLSTFGVSQFDAAGNFVQQLSLPPGTGTGFGNGFENPTGLAVDQNGVLYVADISTASLNGEIYASMEPAARILASSRRAAHWLTRLV